MKRTISFLILFCLLNSVFAQTTNKDILLKSGKIRLENKFNISPKITEIVNGNYYRFIQFSDIPSEEQKEILVEDGINFLEYIPYNTYVVSVPTNFSDIEKLREFGAISLQSILPEKKIDPKLQNGKCPEWALDKNMASIKVLFYKNINIDVILNDFTQKQYMIIETNFTNQYIVLNIALDKINEVSELPYVGFIEPIDPPSFPENKTGRTLHRSNSINVQYAGGRHYNGEGVNVMMQDDGIIGPHIDYTGRIDQSNVSSSSGSHGDHVAGTIMGAGNLDPIAKGMADGAYLYVFSSSNNNYYSVPGIYQNDDVFITSKSYSNGCNAGYTSLARDLDEQIRLYPSLIHVFSAGNNGSSNCGYGAGSGWGNVTGGHKQAKNVITAANLSLTGSLASSSSRGPAHDGRIKPDIGAKGTSVNSTVSTNSYASYSGTSMACPGISGIMAQLYQAYKDLNNGQNPSSALMKCLMLNSADDIGNSGPDFKHGWGEVNAYRAVEILENNQYFSSSVSQSGNNYHTITVPSGTKKIKVMVYWHDKEASVNSSIALVNNINISLTSPTSSTYNPWILDYTPNSTNLNQPATRGIDDRNNMEQVTITNLSSGSYTLNINGFAIPYGPQEYWVTYEFLTDDVQLTYPIGGEGLVSGESEYIRWDAHETSGSFTLQYTINGGSSWNTISNSVSGSSRYYNWTVPNNTTSNAMIRVSRNGYTDQSDATFTIIDVPQNVSVNWLCPDSIYVSWSAVSGATSYEVSMLGQKYMDSMTTTSNLTALIANPNSSITDSWFSVCAKVNNGKGRRAVSVNAQPINPGCIGYGCTDPNAYNYDPTAIYDNGTCIYCNANLPYTENFDNGIGSWTNTGSAGNWTLNSGGTPSTSTGPTDDVTGGGNYMYIEASSPNYPNVGPFTLTSECFDLSGSNNPSLSFYYNMYGAEMGTLNVYANGSLIWSLSGNQGQGWNLVQIPLTSVGNALIIDFEGTTGTSYTSDIAIDNINIESQQLGGCMDSTAINYDPNATVDDGSCIYCSAINLSALVINESMPGSNDGSIDLSVSGGALCIPNSTLSCPILGGNGQSGNAFNIINTSGSPLTITGFSQGPASGNNSATNVTMEAYMFPGDYTNNMTSSGWLMVGTAVVDLTTNSTTGYIPVSGVVIPTGGTYGFWIGRTSGTQQYTNGTGTPGVTIWQSDANITITEGHGGTYPLGFNFSPRNWNGTIHYGDTTNLYTFIWSNGATTEDIYNLSSGSYSVTVTDCIGCSESGSWTVLNNAIYGCTDSTACNYNPAATIDDGSCTYPGCTDPIALNYNAAAGCDDGSCTYCVYGCMDPTAFNYNSSATCDSTNGTVCIPIFMGCTDPSALNYYSAANTDDGSCLYIGCNDPSATNYSANNVGCNPANPNDMSCCIYPATCGAITGVNLTDVIHDRVTFNWDNMNTSTCVVDQIRIRYREVGTNAYSTKTMGSPVGNNAPCLNTYKLVLNLSPSTQYEYGFKIWYQNGTVVTWHAGGTFTTSPVCYNVINITATPITTTKTTFCWSSLGSAYAFVRLKYRENVPGSLFSNIGGFGVFSPTLCKDKNGLTPGTQYRVMWRTWCNPNGGPYRSPQWDGPVIWTQPSSIRFSESDLNEKILIRITDILGREVNPDKVIDKTTLLYIYSDGSVEKKIKIE